MNATERYKEAVRSFGKNGCSIKEAQERVKKLYSKWARDKIKKSRAVDKDRQIGREIWSRFFNDGVGEGEGFKLQREQKPHRIYYIGPEPKEKVIRLEVTIRVIKDEGASEDTDKGILLEF